MLFRRLQVLSHSEDVDAGSACVVHDRLDLGFSFAQAEHKRGLGVTLRRPLLCVRQYAQRLVVSRAFIADVRRKATDRLEIVGENVGSSALKLRRHE